MSVENEFRVFLIVIIFIDSCEYEIFHSALTSEFESERFCIDNPFVQAADKKIMKITIDLNIIKDVLQCNHFSFFPEITK